MDTLRFRVYREPPKPKPRWRITLQPGNRFACVEREEFRKTRLLRRRKSQWRVVGIYAGEFALTITKNLNSDDTLDASVKGRSLA